MNESGEILNGEFVDKAKSAMLIEKGSLTLQNIIGHDSAKQKLINIFSKKEVPSHHGILLYGPPGNGKTSIIKSIQEEACNFTLFPISPTNFLTNKCEMENMIKSLFKFARMKFPSIILIDDFDQILNSDSDAIDQLISSELHEIDESNIDVFMLAATSAT